MNVDRRVVYERDGGICYLCGKHTTLEQYHLEHVVPIVRGGDHSHANTAVSHDKCNGCKGSKLLEELGEWGATASARLDRLRSARPVDAIGEADGS